MRGMSEWLYYRIFGDPRDPSWYYKLINHVIAPLMESEQHNISKLFFFKYSQYEEEECDERFEVNGPVVYVRLRALVQEEVKESVEAQLKDLIESARGKGVVLGSEKCPYDLAKDLGARFGRSRVDILVDYVDAASRLMIELSRNRNYHEEIDRVLAAIHLSANTLDFQCAGCGQISGRFVMPCTI